MLFMSLEGIPRQSTTDDDDVAAEEAAELELEELLQLPDNKFLLERDVNREVVLNDELDFIERLAWAKNKIRERLTSTMRIDVYQEAESENIIEVSTNIDTVEVLIKKLETEGKEIGRGGDAVVLVDDPALGLSDRGVCYKIALEEVVKRGRNSIRTEVAIQNEFYTLAKQRDSIIGVPKPHFEFEAGSMKLIAMEKLPAASVDDILRGRGRVPEWLDVDVFCDELKAFLDEAHKRGLYHRDMHRGNVMITQSVTPAEKGYWGYVIDFGLSGHGTEGFEPYKKEQAGMVFTYNGDYGIVTTLRHELRDWCKRNRGE